MTYVNTHGVSCFTRPTEANACLCGSRTWRSRTPSFKGTASLDDSPVRPPRCRVVPTGTLGRSLKPSNACKPIFLFSARTRAVAHSSTELPVAVPPKRDRPQLQDARRSAVQAAFFTTTYRSDEEADGASQRYRTTPEEQRRAPPRSARGYLCREASREDSQVPGVSFRRPERNLDSRGRV
jgi:hypothetical protein